MEKFLKKIEKMKNFENLFFCKILSNFYNKFAKKSINLKKNFRSRRQVVQRMLRHLSFKRTFSNAGPAEHRPRLGSGSAGRPVKSRKRAGARLYFPDVISEVFLPSERPTERSFNAAATFAA